ncbi:MAG: hypothetical protein JWP12_344 [Bacteroidetes bacterium]|nr:hypothetical protein [Bacteroidota bacterium]
MKTLQGKIIGFNSDLLPKMVQKKYALMSKNVYRFFRGTCHLYYQELCKEKNIPFSPASWICGDLHMENFGTYKGDNRLVYFDLNDFDEAVLVPASWDLLRFVSSIFIAFETMKIEKKKAMNMAKIFLKVYSQTLADGKSYYIERKTAKGIVETFLTAVCKRKQKDLVKKRCYLKKGKRLITLNKKYTALPLTLKNELCGHLQEWITHNSGRPYNYEVADVVFRQAGLGSLGLKRYCFLLKSTNEKEKYLLVDMKQARKSSLSPCINIQQPAWKMQAERVISIQQRMQNIAPALLSVTEFKKESYVIQEMQPTEDSINLDLIKQRYRDIYQVINDMAILTASAQLRSAGRQGAANADEFIEFGKNENWQQPIIDCALKLVAKTKQDYREFCKGYKEGKY